MKVQITMADFPPDKKNCGNCELKMSSIPDAPMNSFRGDGAADMQTSEEDYPF